MDELVWTERRLVGALGEQSGDDRPELVREVVRWGRVAEGDPLRRGPAVAGRLGGRGPALEGPRQLGVQHRGHRAGGLEVDEQVGAGLVTGGGPALDHPAAVARGDGHGDPQVSRVTPGSGVELDGEPRQARVEQVDETGVAAG